MNIAESTNYIRSMGEEFPGMSRALTLILARSLADRVGRGMASVEQVEALLGHGYDAELVLGLSWAHANETLRLLTVDTVHTPEAPL